MRSSISLAAAAAVVVAVAIAAPASADPAKASIFDAPPLATASYVARISPYFDASGPGFDVERGAFHCEALLRAVIAPHPDDAAIKAGQATCDLALALGLRAKLRTSSDSQIVVVARDGKRLGQRDDILAAARPIDTPAKALLAAWLDYQTTQYTWFDGKAFVGGPDNGRVTPVAGGFEVEVSDTDSKGCAKHAATYAINHYRRVVFVDAQGAVKEHSKTKVSDEQKSCK